MMKLSHEIAVDLSAPPPPKKQISILDIQTDLIKTPPQFTEEATISAMNNLGISPNDLVSIDYRQDDPVSISDDSGMKLQLMNEMEKKRLETIEKIIAERNRILMEGDIEVPIPKTIDDDQSEIEDLNDGQTTNKPRPPRKKKKGKSNLKSGNKKSKVKKKITSVDDYNYDGENLNARNTKRRRRKSSRSSAHKFQIQKAKDSFKARSSSSPIKNTNNDKPSTNRRPSVAERRQKYNSKIAQNQNNRTIKNHVGLNIYDRKIYNEYEANKKNNMMLINIRVKANEERRRMEREEKQELIKRQAQLRMQQQKNEESQFERMKKDKKSKVEEEMKRKERLYMRIQEKKMKALEQEKLKRQQKIYNNKVKQEENNENEDRFAKLRQKIMEAQNKKANENSIPSQSNDDDDVDLFSVTQPKRPKLLAIKSDNVSNSSKKRILSTVITSKSGINSNNSISTKQTTNSTDLTNDNLIPIQKAKSKPVTNAKPLLSSTLNPQPVRKPLPQQNPKASSSLQRKDSAYYKQLLKLPVVGKNKTKIPCLHK